MALVTLENLVDLVKASEIHGRGLTSKSSTRRGTTLTRQDPIVVAVEDDSMDTVCSGCCKSLEEVQGNNRCSKCKVVRYCSQECQRSDWRDHKEECGSLVQFEKKLKESAQAGAEEGKILRVTFPSATVRVTARLLRMRHRDKAAVRGIYSI